MMLRMNDPNFPNDFKERIINAYGEKGLAWLNDLPNIITQAENKYGVSNITALPQLSFNYTTRAIEKNGRSIIVKFCLPGRETDNEIDTLSMMRGDGIVELLDYDKKQGILLLEECRPGKTLATVDHNIEATRYAACVINKIQKPAPDDIKFLTTHDWFSRLDAVIKLPSGFLANHLSRAKSIARELHHQSKQQILLHGDLHHFNILSAQRQPWLAIDPKGIVGPPEYECGAFLRNPIPQIATKHNLRKILADRVSIFSEILKFDRYIVIGWGYSQAILASVWCVDMKSDDWRIFLKCAEELYSLHFSIR